MTKDEFSNIAHDIPAGVLLHGDKRSGYLFCSATQKQYGYDSYNSARQAIHKIYIDLRDLSKKHDINKKQCLE